MTGVGTTPSANATTRSRTEPDGAGYYAGSICRGTRMLRIATLTAALSALLAAPAIAQQRPEVEAAAKSVQQDVVSWRRDLHQHPELGNQETRTAKVIADHLRTLGMDPKTGIGATGVAAVLKGGKPGPRIALRADMDALPVTEDTGYRKS